MKRLWKTGLLGLCIVFISFAQLSAAPYAAMVMDARSGEVLHSRNADTRLHPASLTKMMTLYVTFDAVRRGELTLDTQVRVSKYAASKPPSKLYLKAGQTIALRYLIRASAVKSANDAAVVLAEAVAGSEAAFAKRMNKMARAMGMKNTNFKNPHGLTQKGHYSSARDMTLLGRHLFYDYPEYYNLFSRRSTDAKVTTVHNTNRRLLNAYRGADGIKTGYTQAAGFNLVASAERNGVRIIATMFGGTSGAARNARVAELLDMGFARAPRYAQVNKPRRPNPGGFRSASLVLERSARPTPRPNSYSLLAATSAEQITDQVEIANVVADVSDKLSAGGSPAALASTAGLTAIERPTARPEEDTPQVLAETVEIAQAEETETTPTTNTASALSQAQAASAFAVASIASDLAAEDEPSTSGAGQQAAALASADQAEPSSAPTKPARPPATIVFSTSGSAAPNPAAPQESPVIVASDRAAQATTAITIGLFASQYEAERVLLRTALQELDTLADAQRRVVQKKRGFEARFVGLSPRNAELTCQRLSARSERCAPVGS
ncbi:MAG: serine hydrolase [Mangrovicoccus sp.]